MILGVKWIVKKLFITSDMPKILKKNWTSQGPCIKELANPITKNILLLAGYSVTNSIDDMSFQIGPIRFDN